jgi:hypothetical protein
MTYLQILNIIKRYAESQPNINTVVREFLDLNREDTKYSAVVIQDRDGLRSLINSQDYITYTWHLGYVDRLLDDESNRDEIYSTGMVILNNIVNSIRNDYFPQLDIEVVDRFNTFNQRFTASCAGVYIVISVNTAISDCDSGYREKVFSDLSKTITSNGVYHYVPEGRDIAWDDAYIKVAVSGAPKAEEKLVETITSNGRFSFSPQEDYVYSDAQIDVFVSGTPKAEESLVETITSNGDYSFTPEENYVYNSVAIGVDVHPSERLSRRYTTNGQKDITGEFKDGTITVDVHPSSSLSETYTSNGVYQISGEFSGGTVAVDVHPSSSLSETYTSNGVYPISGEFKDGTVSVDVHPSSSLSETYTSNGVYQISGEFKDGTVAVSVDTRLPETVCEIELSDIQSIPSVITPASGTVFNRVEISSLLQAGPIHIDINRNGRLFLPGEVPNYYTDITIDTLVEPSVISMSQEQYNNLSVIDPNTIYLITG